MYLYQNIILHSAWPNQDKYTGIEWVYDCIRQVGSWWCWVWWITNFKMNWACISVEKESLVICLQLNIEIGWIVWNGGTCMVVISHIYINRQWSCFHRLCTFVEMCWSTYNFIHNVKRNIVNRDLAESLVNVHCNLRLLSHYCDATNNDWICKTWDINPGEDNLEEGAIALEDLEAELLVDGTHDIDHVTKMPAPFTTISFTTSTFAWGLCRNLLEEEPFRITR